MPEEIQPKPRLSLTETPRCAASSPRIFILPALPVIAGGNRIKA